MGVPLPGTSARIVDWNSGEPLPAGEVGELLVAGPQVMRGYWNLPDDTAAVLQDGWLGTGDLARMDEDGYFTIVDRKKDESLARGYNVYPHDEEADLHEDRKELKTGGVRGAD